MTNVPPIQFTPAGVIVPTDAAILAGVQADINAAFGGGVNPALNTPQGQLASSLTAIISDKNSQILYLSNQFDPQYASGRYQDALGDIYFQTRIGATSTAVTCVLGGLPGTVISAGTFAKDTSNNIYALLGSVTIGSGSTVSSSWQNVATGPIACPAGTLTQVYQAIPGWDTITNPADGVPGANVETRAEFELRRQSTVAINSRGSNQAIRANVFQTVTGILDCYVIDNPSGNNITQGSSNYPMLPHSVYVGVVGGSDADVAMAIWLKKDDGCDYNGNTIVQVFDTVGYSLPYPSYLVKFNRPTSTPVLFAVQIQNSATLPAGIVALIQAAIIAQFNGTDTINPARMGSAITGSSYYGAVSAVALGIVVLSILVGITSATLNQVVMGIDQSPVIDAGDIAVVLL